MWCCFSQKSLTISARLFCKLTLFSTLIIWTKKNQRFWSWIFTHCSMRNDSLLIVITIVFIIARVRIVFDCFLDPVYKRPHSGVVAILIFVSATLAPAHYPGSHPTGVFFLRIHQTHSNKRPSAIPLTSVIASLTIPGTKSGIWVDYVFRFVPAQTVFLNSEGGFLQVPGCLVYALIIWGSCLGCSPSGHIASFSWNRKVFVRQTQHPYVLAEFGFLVELDQGDVVHEVAFVIVIFGKYLLCFPVLLRRLF